MTLASVVVEFGPVLIYTLVTLYRVCLVTCFFFRARCNINTNSQQ